MAEPSIGGTLRPTLVVVGAAARDVDAADPRGWRLGGTVAYAALTAARLGLAVGALVGVDEEASGAHELELLRDAGVDVRLARLVRGPVFDNRPIDGGGRVQVAQQASDRLSSASLPDEWRTVQAALLGPIAAELGDEWADAFPRTTFVALAWQGLLRGIVAGQQVEQLVPARTALVARVDALALSVEDVADVQTRLRELLERGQDLLFTHGQRGALGLQRSDRGFSGRYAPPVQEGAAVDATGAGDVFLAAWMAARLLAPNAPTDRHLLIASNVAGLSVATRGLAELPGRPALCAALLRRRARSGS